MEKIRQLSPQALDTLEVAEQVAILKRLILEVQQAYQKKVRFAFEAGFDAASHNADPLEAYLNFIGRNN